MSFGIVSAWCILLLIVSIVISTILVYFIKQFLAVNRQMQEIIIILDDIIAGNANRRILLTGEERLAPLAYKINEMVYAYEEKLIRLHSADQNSKQLMTSLSHDVRTPLTTLIGYLDVVCKGRGTGSDCQSMIEIARDKAHSLKEYVEVLFDWFKIHSNEWLLEMKQVELGELTRNILKDWIPVFDENQIQYDFEIPEHRIMVALDWDVYPRILNNLIQNVISHSRASQIRIGIQTVQETAQISIWDNGMGIEEKDLVNIFERLYQCDHSHSARGSGLGLSIVKQMVEKMGGTILAESVVNNYTVFRISFPLQRTV